MSAALNLTRNFESEICCTCGVEFWIPALLDRNLRNSKQMFYCPSGHPQSYTESEADRLRKELEAERTRKTQALARENEQRARAAAAENKLKRQTNRISKGLCTCCNRTFANLARHMATKHKEQTP